MTVRSSTLRPTALLAVLVMLTPANAQTNIETPGNLQATRDLGCIAPAEFKPQYTPADLAPAIVACAQAGRTEDALFLFATMIGYAAFDGQRVTDETAAQARSVLSIQVGQTLKNGDADVFAAWEKTLRTALDKGSPLTPEQCALHRELGPPDYRPDYMIAHGIKAVTGSDEPPLKSDFDAAATWDAVLTNFLRCDAG